MNSFGNDQTTMPLKDGLTVAMNNAAFAMTRDSLLTKEACEALGATEVDLISARNGRAMDNRGVNQLETLLCVISDLARNTGGKLVLKIETADGTSHDLTDVLGLKLRDPNAIPPQLDFAKKFEYTEPVSVD